MRGVSTRRGTAMSTTTTRTTTTATTVSSQMRSRLIAPRGLPLLDRGQLEAARSDRPHERPVFLERLRLRVRAIDDGAGGVVHDPVEHLAGEAHGDEVLATFLPGLADLRTPHVDTRHPVRATRLTESVALRLQRRDHLGRQRITDTAEVATVDRILHGQEHRARCRAKAVRIEATVHLPNVTDAALEIGDRRGSLHGRGVHGAARRGAAARRTRVRWLRARRAPAHEGDEQQEAPADQEYVEKADTHAMTGAAERKCT